MADLKFLEYRKMGIDLNKFECTKELKETEWIVLEKIHGANFSFVTDGTNVKVARRRDFLSDGENFFNHQNAQFMRECPKKVKSAFKLAENVIGEKLEQINIYGELFGGLYSADGIAEGKIKAVQSEVQYCPDVRWAAFDIAYQTPQMTDEEYMDPSSAMEIFESVGIFYLKPLFKGAMNDAIHYPIGFDSVLPGIFGLPPMPRGTNKAEGIVVKPVRSIKCQFVKSRGTAEPQRVILKIKIDNFEEIRRTPKDKRSGMVLAQNGGNENRHQPKTQSAQKRMIAHVMTYATEQRLVNAISKVGRSEDRTEELAEEFKSDVMKDLLETENDANEIWHTLDDQKKGMITDILGEKTQSLIKKLR